MPCFRTTPRIAKEHAEGYEEGMREADFVGRVTRRAWMLPTWELVPTEGDLPVAYLWGSRPHAGATVVPWGRAGGRSREAKRGRRIFQAMLRCKPLPPIVVERWPRRGSHEERRPGEHRKWEVIDGHHRVSMAMILGITHVPAIISTEEYSREGL